MPGNDHISLLLIEDSPHDVELVLAVLERSGYSLDVQVMHDRANVVSALSRQSFDLIVSDFILPGFSGAQALEIARQLAPETPFLFLSGVFGEQHAVEMMRLGAVDYVLKQNMSLLPQAVGRAVSEVRERRERRRVTDELHRVEARARLAIDAANLGTWEFDPRSGELILDERSQAMFAFTPTTPVTLRKLAARCHPSDRRLIRSALRQAMSPDGRDGYHVEFRVRLADGPERWLSSRGRAFVKDGTCLQFVGVLADVTEQRLAAEALERLNETLGERVERRTRERDRTWELSRDLLAVVDYETRPVALNPAWEEALCWPRRELMQRSMLALLHPDDVASTRQDLQRLRQGKLTTRFINRLRHADGSYRSISWGAVPDEDKLYIVGRDITSEIAVIDELAQTNRQLLEQIDERERVEATLQQMQRLEAVGQLTAGVAHDFNNLLTIILINATFLGRDLEKGVDREKMAGRLHNIRDAGERGARLTNQLLAFSRRQQLTPEPVNLNDTLVGMLDLLKSTLGGGVWVETDTADALWPALVDPTQIELIILNLAINARDAMGSGGTLRLATANQRITAAAQRAEEPEPGEYVVLIVEDTGSGMSDEVLAKAFEPFFTTKEIGKGSGLGLAQVFGFAKQSGGGAAIETKLGVGTTVKVYLPRALLREALATSSRPRGPDAEHGSLTARVLLVDDDPNVREVTAAMLDQLGYEVLVADSGPNALVSLERGAEVDLLLADFAMPGMNGGELASLVNARFPDLPVVFVTGYAELGRLNAGETLIVQKPFTEELLDDTLRQAIGRARCLGEM
ncbi:response regulator [Stutzerimonas tarimensis]|uniref:histidine kinase n=1 Tax=Stutzerimonas tarimensis TaxID=1507735 RepID=A0ABV7T777_9GAMM